MSFVQIKQFSVYIIKISCTLPPVFTSLYALCQTWNLNCTHRQVEEEEGDPRRSDIFLKKKKKNRETTDWRRGSKDRCDKTYSRHSTGMTLISNPFFFFNHQTRKSNNEYITKTSNSFSFCMASPLSLLLLIIITRVIRLWRRTKFLLLAAIQN